jgi:hypothetical protein
MAETAEREEWKGLTTDSLGAAEPQPKENSNHEGTKSTKKNKSLKAQ